MIVIAAILTYIIPAGEFDRQQIEGTSRAVVVAGSYHRVAQSPVSFIGMFKAIPLGFAASANIIAMILFSAGAFQVVLENGKIADTIINALSSPLVGLPTIFGAILMTIVHGFINFFIPSGSGQAAATMPIMFPIGDLIGMTKQTSILAFQIGDGVTNIMIPTMGSLMAVCALAHVPFEKWFKFSLRLVAGVYIVGWIFLSIAVAIDWGPF